jgi:hypothetical protein
VEKQTGKEPLYLARLNGRGDCEKLPEQGFLAEWSVATAVKSGFCGWPPPTKSKICEENCVYVLAVWPITLPLPSEILNGL